MRKGRLLAVVAAVLVMTVALAPAVLAATAGDPISNVLEATLAEESLDAPTIEIHDDLSGHSVVGLWDVFTVSTTPGGHANEPVRVKIELTQGSADGFTLDYFETAGGLNEFRPLNFDTTATEPTAWYGPGGGFPLAEADSLFRVTWHKAGTYTTRTSIMGKDAAGNFTEVLAQRTVTVEVSDGQAIDLSWSDGSTDTLNLTYRLNEAFDVAAQAELASDGPTHVDGVLYIVQVSKDGGAAATPDDLTITGTGGQSLGYDAGGGYFFWGPPSGFTFGCVSGMTPNDDCAPNGATTTFTVTVKTSGTYEVDAYAVQVKPQAAGPIPGN